MSLWGVTIVRRNSDLFIPKFIGKCIWAVIKTESNILLDLQEREQTMQEQKLCVHKVFQEEIMAKVMTQTFESEKLLKSFHS